MRSVTLADDKKRFTKREWLLSISIISLIQAFIWYAAFVNAGNGSALNFISFAGTLVSIILAVLAIGYTYGEAQVQKNESNSVVQQVSKLNDVIGNLEYQSGNMNKLEDISFDLSELTKKLEMRLTNTHKEVEKVSSTLSQMVSLEGSFDDSESASVSFKDKKEAIKLLLTNLTAFECIVLSIIIKCADKPTYSLYAYAEKYIEESNVEVSRRDSLLNMVHGGNLTFFNILRGLGIIEREGLVYTIDEVFENLIIEQVKSKDLKSQEGSEIHNLYKQVISEL